MEAILLGTIFGLLFFICLLVYIMNNQYRLILFQSKEIKKLRIQNKELFADNLSLSDNFYSEKNKTKEEIH